MAREKCWVTGSGPAGCGHAGAAMIVSPHELAARIIRAGARFVLALTGGGSRAIAELLEIPGASRAVLGAHVPYCEAALADWLGAPAEQACAEPTARAMAMAAFHRAWRCDPAAARLAGFAATASLATDWPKRGPHRVHLAAQTAEATASLSLELHKGLRSRAEEEQVACALVLNLMAETLNLTEQLALGLGEGESLQRCRQVAPEPWRDLLLGRIDCVCHGGPAESAPPSAARTVFPGAFHPLHVGHRRMAQLAQDLLGRPVEFEISLLNVEKPPLDYVELARRTGQFAAGTVVWLTRASTFVEKSRLFPGATFVVGADTLRRIADPRYYGNQPAACRQAIDEILARACRFLVFGRQDGLRFVTLADLDLPVGLRSACEGVPAERFREDICSTALRRGDRP